MLKNGVATAIIGAPNAGKSSLLNALVGFDRAIVTDIAGTTRDTVEEKATVGGVLLRLIDTAGLHETDDLVEQLGVERSKKAVEDADLILALLDGSTGLPASEARAAEMLAPLELAAKSGKPWLLLLTKSDLGGGAGIVPDKDWRTPGGDYFALKRDARGVRSAGSGDPHALPRAERRYVPRDKRPSGRRHPPRA